uniref:(northern house mosquito) hypothetical protein n=1 Tax=Culex pipiens TaxID=7175 RepID=A0A8D8FPN4_CULPI
MTISNLLLQRQQTDLCDRPLELSSVRRLHRDNACHAVVSRVGCHNPTEWPLQWRCVVVNQQHQRALLDLLRLQPLCSLLSRPAFPKMLQHGLHQLPSREPILLQVGVVRLSHGLHLAPDEEVCRCDSCVIVGVI